MLREGDRDEEIGAAIVLGRMRKRKESSRALALERAYAGEDFYGLHGCVGRKEDRGKDSFSNRFW